MAEMILREGEFAVRVDGDEEDGYAVKLTVGHDEAVLTRRYARLQAAEQAARRIWRRLFPFE